jgi:hypothetical protein
MTDKNVSNFPRKPVKINYEENLRFQAIDWIECDESIDTTLNSTEYLPKYKRDHDKRYIIFCFGVTEEGHSVCVKIKNYRPYFQVKIPEGWDKEKISDFEYSFLKSDNIATDEDEENFDTQEEIAQDKNRSWMPKETNEN